MAVSPNYRTFVLDQLGRVLPKIRARSMFGGVGIYSGDFFFALIADDVLYFKVDDVTRPDYEARGMPPFRPYGEGGEAMQYYQVSEELLEDVGTLQTWADAAVAVARRKKAGRGRRPRA